MLIRREFGAVNHKRVERLYALAELQIPRCKRRSRVGPQLQLPLALTERPMQRWSMDFVHEALYNGHRFRTFDVVDDFTREAIAIEVDTSLSSERIIRVFERLRVNIGLPEQLTCDNGT